MRQLSVQRIEDLVGNTFLYDHLTVELTLQEGLPPKQTSSKPAKIEEKKKVKKQKKSSKAGNNMADTFKSSQAASSFMQESVVSSSIVESERQKVEPQRADRKQMVR